MNIQTVKQRFGIVGNAPALDHAINVAVRVAATNLTVLITGESGVGKEIFSKIITQLGPRKHNPFIAVNCGAIPEGTIDSELFGHEKGAFTGAHEKRKGYFESVDGGTIFLDEIGEMPLGTQARLLRLLESGEFIKVGSSKVQTADVRVVAATNVNLPKLVAKGKFREDLYYRLNTVPIIIPPLRDRGDDVLQLMRKFMVDFAERNRMQAVKLTEHAKQLIIKYPWPGNIRQLKNVSEQISVLAESREIDAPELLHLIPDMQNQQLPMVHGQDDIPGHTERELLYKMIFDLKDDIQQIKPYLLKLNDQGIEFDPEVVGGDVPQFLEQQVPQLPSTFTDAGAGFETDNYTRSDAVIISDSQAYTEEEVEESLSIADKEKELIIKALKKYKGKRKDAADELGISERTLYRKIKEYEIQG